MMAKCGRCGFNLPLAERFRDLIPNLHVRLDQRASVNCPAMKSDRSFCCDKASGLHLLGPEAIMRGDNKLRVGEMGLQKPTELIAVPGVHRHDNVVQQCD